MKWLPFIELIEKPLYHSIYKYCGRIDVPFIHDDGLDLVDVKTGSIPFHTKYQLEAYGELLRNRGAKVYNLYALNLPGDGTYKLKHYGSARDLSVFQAAVTIENAKRGLI